MEYYHERVETESRVPARIYYGGTGMDKLRYPLHWHHNLEFDLVLEGCIRGKIGGREAEIYAGEIFFVNSGELHETDACTGGTMRSVTVLLSDELLREYCPDLDLWEFSFEQGSAQEKELAGLIAGCARVQKEKSEYYELELSILLRQICMVLLRDCRRKKEASAEGRGAGKSMKRVKKAISYMEENYENPLPIQEMARVLGMTPTYFSRYFRQYTGQTFHSYLTRIRLCHAQRLLLEGEDGITAIALDSGFPNVKSFIEAFRREYGLTPARYRREWEREKKS